MFVRFAEQVETDWSPITTLDGWIMIQSPTTEKLPQTQESTTEPVVESTIQSLTSGILIVAFGSTPLASLFAIKQLSRVGKLIMQTGNNLKGMSPKKYNLKIN